MKKFSVIRFNFPALLGQLTGTHSADWEEVNGPESRCGLDYWYRHKITGEEIFINLDQAYLSILSLEAGATLFAGLYTEFTSYKRFIAQA